MYVLYIVSREKTYKEKINQSSFHKDPSFDLRHVLFMTRFSPDPLPSLALCLPRETLLCAVDSEILPWPTLSLRETLDQEGRVFRSGTPGCSNITKFYLEVA